MKSDIYGTFLILLVEICFCSLFQEPPIRQSKNGVLETTLTVTSQVFRAEGALQVQTRVYEGNIPGPTLRVKPGDVLKIHLVNNLEDNGEHDQYKPPNTMRNPNTTNLHVHGLHVSPEGNSDNVMLMCQPGETLDYVYLIPTDHACGTFWYHAHHHGSQALQIGGGLLGALIVEEPAPELLDPNLANMKETLLLIHHFLFKRIGWGGIFHDHDNLMMISEMSDSDLEFNLESLSPAGSEEDKNWFLINGQFRPEIPIHLKIYQRFRIVNAGPSELLELEINPPNVCEMAILAMDGIYLDEVWRVNTVVIPPAGRADVAVKCNQVGRHELWANASTSRDKYLGRLGQRYNGLLAIFFAERKDDDAGVVDLPKNLPSRNNSAYLQDLMNVKVLTSQNMYTIDLQHNSTSMMDFRINGIAFDPELNNHTVFLNEIQQWALINSENESNHPYHQHVHPFQIVSFNGMTHPSAEACEATGMKIGMWRDTIPLTGFDDLNVHAVVRFNPQDFEGDVMLHCHIPSHSDLGMAQMIHVYPSQIPTLTPWNLDNWSPTWLIYSVIVVAVLIGLVVVKVVWTKSRKTNYKPVRIQLNEL